VTEQLSELSQVSIIESPQSGVQPIGNIFVEYFGKDLLGH
jgi:hypothetical protein